MAYDKDNIFAKILRGEIPAEKVYEDDVVFAFKDIQPAAETHVLVIPKNEYSSFDDFAAKADPETVQGFFLRVREIAKGLGVDKTGYRLITNHGKNSNQTVAHFHVHILGGEPLGPLVAGDKNLR